MISISTAWMPETGRPIEQVLDTLQPLGPKMLEFNYRVHPLNLDATRRELERRGLGVSSLHNICSTNGRPVPEDDRYGDSVASLDEPTRLAGVAHLTATARAARALGARAVVVHGGTVEAVKGSPVYRRAMAESSRANSPEPLKARMPELLAARQATAAQNLARLIASLKEVCRLFPDLQFGLEARYHFHGMPSFDELEQVWDEVDCPNLGYWHDCGHAQFQQNLGIRRHEDWLERYQTRLVGVHLHGMGTFMLDHYAPTSENMDFGLVRRYVNGATTLVMEVSPENTTEAVLRGKAYLESLFGN